jgi:2-polyprenyl-6-hydroxyphenyl methylase/3-demethylubiquinone-9 3-methyltransferase
VCTGGRKTLILGGATRACIEGDGRLNGSGHGLAKDLSVSSVLLDHLSELPPLDRRAPFRRMRPCKVCGMGAVPFDRVDFNKYCSVTDFYEYGMAGVSITYHRCLSCGFIFTEDLDDWPAEKFAKLIYNADYVKVDGEYVHDRPMRAADDFARRLAGCEHASILDYGSGAGVFVDRRRACGFRHVEAYDPFSSPRRPAGAFDIITSFEVIEHSPDPLGTLQDMQGLLRRDGCILFSQTVQPPDILSIRGNWWYLAPRNGHVSTFTEEALFELGRRRNFVLHKGDTVYGFASRLPSSFATFAVDSIGPSLSILRLLAPRASLNAVIAFPSAQDVLWHPADATEIWQYRWTGGQTLWWDAQWQDTELLQVRIPVLQEQVAGFAAGCEIEFAGVRKPVLRDRGEIVAEFATHGLTSGNIALHMPERLAGASDPTGRGLAILLDQAPLQQAQGAECAVP